jgi:hypothetical protein
LVGLSTAKTFPGFESEDGNVKVLITELPPAAYGEVVSAFNSNPAGTNGVKQDKIETPEHIKLMAISAAAGSGQTFPTLEALADAARRTIVDYRSGVLGDAVQRTGRGGSPPALPGSLPVPSGPVKFDSLRAASKAAEEAIKRGELPLA